MSTSDQMTLLAVRAVRSDADCEIEPTDLTSAKARQILRIHVRHRPCYQAMAALAYLSESDC